MGTTSIEWTRNPDGSKGKTWNPVTGCTPVSPGCQNCYAARMAKRLAGRAGYPKDKPFAVTLHPDKLEDPLRWRKPSRVFVVSMGDLFHDDVPLDYIADVFNVMAAWRLVCRKKETEFGHHHDEPECYGDPGHTYMILTKRPERMRSVIDHELHNWIGERWPGDTPLSIADWPLPNVSLGVTAENQEMADQRIPILLDTPAAKRFVSVEPCLSEVDLTPWLRCGSTRTDGPVGYNTQGVELYGLRLTPPLDLCILGGETGPGARPMHPDWARKVRNDCEAAGVPFFLKQLDAKHNRLLDGVEHNGEVRDGGR